MSVAQVSNSWVKPDPMSDPQSLERRFRARRFFHVRRLIEGALQTKKRIEILDLGGTEAYWTIADDFLSVHRGRISIILVNNETAAPVSEEMFVSVAGDACDPELYAGRRYDLVHSNSVIEHVGDVARMRAFADNVRRLGERYFVQTPNFWFPLEPHFRVPGFQWLPLAVRVAMMQRFNLGFFPKARSYDEAYRNVADIRLLDRKLMRQLFPGATLVDEKVAGLTKSLMAIGGDVAD
ncbi:class I SAM-dependent methyltransferase [Jiella sp. MQZ9-1]|uniref:SAM-dependent methyltransferase n=1 Tax=Jiella flava TaxID=2816857 RepID=A0A939G023_9HYPH|nr:SAM-dependent methyltransferase [Jiella flava]MBO0663341.1 SAM-dependent methyltransferase [Jiella flava]MCD2471917.1 class I SAM-dependent methyltransferase [Jiella flava]